MSAWTTKVGDPFRDDPRFWRAVGLSVDALLAMVLVVVLSAFFGTIALVSLVLPVALLVVAAVDGRASTAQTRPAFADRVAWRDAERQAVAAALPGALVRRRFHHGG